MSDFCFYSPLFLPICQHLSAFVIASHNIDKKPFEGGAPREGYPYDSHLARKSTRMCSDIVEYGHSIAPPDEANPNNRNNREVGVVCAIHTHIAGAVMTTV